MKKMQNVIISIQGGQIESESSQMFFSELVTDGQMIWEEGGCLLAYQENPVGPAWLQTTLIISLEMVTLIRNGDVDMHMVFECDRKHTTHYDTNEGVLTVGVIANRVKCDLTDSGGVIEIDYTVEIDSEIAGENRIKISISPAKCDFSGFSPERGIVHDQYIN
ncbi:MAG: DUF1934 domain-containing protein [Oscillospiraceae bacterium]|nr:DUF1934 domain-containing protein [Oscillospiraceae bacterium]